MSIDLQHKAKWLSVFFAVRTVVTLVAGFLGVYRFSTKRHAVRSSKLGESKLGPARKRVEPRQIPK